MLSARRRFALLLCAVPLALPAARGEDDPNAAALVEVQTGTLPIIITAPQGGSEKVPGVPERMGVGVKNFATLRDNGTDKLAKAFAADLEKQLGKKPWVVIARFDRKYIDANRAADQAYEDKAAKPYYDAYHDPLVKALKAVKEKFGYGILLDIHGQSKYPDAVLRGTQNGKSVVLLRQRHGYAAVAGKNSILGRFEAAGNKVFPTAAAGEKAKEETGYSGGYTVSQYGSHTTYGIDAMQLVVGTKLRSAESLPKTAKDLADATVAFHDAYLKK
ncbi:N-formylglutamate amidohydrolase [bacterium]|nr:N-formylglutamate amidohydrolase [bacterium]